VSDLSGRSWLRSLESDPGALRDDAELLERLSRLLLAALPRDQLEPLARRAWSELVGVELVQVARTTERNSDPERVRVSLVLSTDEVSAEAPFTLYGVQETVDAAQFESITVQVGDGGPIDVVAPGGIQIGNASESLAGVARELRLLPTQEDVDELAAAVEAAAHSAEHWIEVELQDGSFVEVEDWPATLQLGEFEGEDDEEFLWDEIPPRLREVLVEDLGFASELDQADRATRRAESGFPQ